MRVDPVGARCTAQLLSGRPAASAEEAVGRVLAVQGQDPRGFRLAVRARTRGVTAADVDAALSGSRTLVVSWLNRGTLHLVGAQDFWWLHDLTTPRLRTESLRRLAQEGVSPEQAELGVETVAAAVAEAPRTRDELRAALDAVGVPTAGQALVHVLLAATLRHRLIRGPVQDGEHRMVLAEDWLGPAPEPLDRGAALALLARRYLEGHGPSSDRDLAVWAKLPLRDARAGLAAIDTVAVGDGLVDLPEREEPAPLPTRLLGNFDPILHGWASREAVLGVHDPQVVAGGIFRSWAFAGGRPVGLWRIAGGRVRISPFGPLAKRTEHALLQDAAAVLAYLGMPEKEAEILPA
ncbi:winged helix DNA-binding domain-containing protein [Amnibacterium sp.]|uniref:winged helix DNA-binding domain-containing protein n=1 Tax=Amnibacterium sp. TaxID=1872496 RepID=UPI003F7C7A89